MNATGRPQVNVNDCTAIVGAGARRSSHVISQHFYFRFMICDSAHCLFSSFPLLPALHWHNAVSVYDLLHVQMFAICIQGFGIKEMFHWGRCIDGDKSVFSFIRIFLVEIVFCLFCVLEDLWCSILILTCKLNWMVTILIPFASLFLNSRLFSLT